MTGRYRLHGANGSPYSVKVRATLRYWRIPFDWVRICDGGADVMKRVKVPVIPILEHPDGQFENESTQLLLRLDGTYPERRIVPPDPALAFLVRLLEDMADEWATKLMFHFRWHDPIDRAWCSQWIARDRLGPAGADAIDRLASEFSERQVARMALVGVQASNRPVLAESYRRVLAIFNAHLADAEFLFGDRPSLADFAWYGQLWDLGIDPSPAVQMRETAPRVLPWLLRIDDLSGHEGGDWRPLSDGLLPAASELLSLAGDVYLPFLDANARALEQGSERFSLRLLGHEFEQAPFKFQVRCLQQLRALYAGLPPQAREQLDPLLERANCRHWLAAQA